MAVVSIDFCRGRGAGEREAEDGGWRRGGRACGRPSAYSSPFVRSRPQAKKLYTDFVQASPESAFRGATTLTKRDAVPWHTTGPAFTALNKARLPLPRRLLCPPRAL